MYGLGVAALAVATGNVLFQKNTEKKTHAWHVSSCPRASGALSPPSCLATSHLSPPFAPSACFWCRQEARCAVTDLEHVLICQLAAIWELWGQPDRRDKGWALLSPARVHLCSLAGVFSPSTFAQSEIRLSLLNLPSPFEHGKILGAAKMPLIAMVEQLVVFEYVI